MDLKTNLENVFTSTPLQIILKIYLEIVCETILEDALIINAFGVFKTYFINNFEDLPRDFIEFQFSRRLKS